MNLEKDFTKEDYLQNLDKLFGFISDIDRLYNSDFLNLEEYWKIQNRILDEMITLRNFEKEVLEGDKNDRK